MVAEYETTVEMKGTLDEVKAMLDVFKEYSHDKDIYFECAYISRNYNINTRNRVYLDSNQSKIDEYIEKLKGRVVVHAMGPWGRFSSLLEVGLYKRLSEAAPNAYFNMMMSGSDDYDGQSLNVEQKKGKIKICGECY